MTFASPDTGERVNRTWQLPTSYAELVARREALERWSELHYGFLGRSPDHVASCIAEAYALKTANCVILYPYQRGARLSPNQPH